MSPQSIPRTMSAEIQTMTRLVWYCRLRHLQDRPEVLVNSVLGSCITVSCNRSIRALSPVAGLTGGSISG